MGMYGDLMNVKINFNDQMKAAALKAFEQISCGAPSFDLDAFSEARLNHPELLSWIEEPEEFLKGSIDQPQPVPFEVFQKYHDEVLSEFEAIEMEISTALKIRKKSDVEKREDSLMSSNFANKFRQSMLGKLMKT